MSKFILLSVLLASSVSVVMAEVSYSKTKPEEKKTKTSQSRGPADNCSKRETIFGKIIATCGDRNLVYAGKQKMFVLGTEYVAPVFELTFCKGGPRLTLVARPHSEGFEFKLAEPHVLKYGKDGKPELFEEVTVSHAWGRFVMNLQQSDGTTSQVPCERYEDTRSNIDYLQ